MTQPPFFFTSYAGRDADSELVGQFHARLQQEVAIKRGVSAAHEGFLDTDSLEHGARWRRDLSQALGTTRFLIALLSDDFFERKWCGREWAVMEERMRLAGDPEPIAVLPLFWVPVARELPPSVAEIQHRTPRFGKAYRHSCVVDLMRGDRPAYEKLVIALVDHMVRKATAPLPEMDATTAAEFPPTFGLSAKPEPADWETAAPVHQSKADLYTPRGGPFVSPPARANRSGAPLSGAERLTLVQALVRSPVGLDRDTWNVWLVSVRQMIEPKQLSMVSDDGQLRNRVVSVVNFALAQKSPKVMQALADALDFWGDEEGVAEVRLLVDKAVENWPAR
ncbi:toll/interleukin-1 receptor domain-containing protein [Streptomyces umbrinus]|uniref:toll/interleukin-1 receptor domain-containing protein n=1 Tax=Streptomyces umbrinus TaxID=67370 RepID=UPI0033DB184F